MPVLEHWSVLIETLRDLVDGDSVKMSNCVFSIMHGGAGSHHMGAFGRENGSEIIHDLCRQPGSGLRDVFTLD